MTTVTQFEQLEELDLDFEGVKVHCWEGGAGRAVVLLHGSGAGANTESNFRRVLAGLTEEFHVLAADLVGFGRSGLRAAPPFFDMAMWVRQLQMLLDHLGPQSALVVGHSLSGAIALRAASIDPRIAAVVTTGTMGVPPKAEGGPRWTFPQTADDVRRAVERTFYDKSYAEPAEVERRLAVLGRPGYREYFETMFAGPSDQYIRASALSEQELAQVGCPVVLMHGVADASHTPEESSLVLAKRLRNVDVYILSDCAHSVAHERPREFITTVTNLWHRVAERAVADATG